MTRKHLLSLAGIALLCVPAIAQSTPLQPVPAPSGPDQGGRMMHEGGRHEGGGFGMGMMMPPGMWWKNPDVVARLALTPDQQKRMDEIFRQSRIQLVDLKATLEKEQINLEPLLNQNPPDEARTLGEISKIADLRADLEKANAKMLLGLRGVLTADQWTKVQERHRSDRMQHMDGQGGFHGQPGPGASAGSPAGPGGPGLD